MFLGPRSRFFGTKRLIRVRLVIFQIFFVPFFYSMLKNHAK